MVLSKLNDPDSVGSLCRWMADYISGARPALGKLGKD